MAKFTINKRFSDSVDVEADRYFYSDGMVHFVSDDGSGGKIQNYSAAASKISTIQLVTD